MTATVRLTLQSQSHTWNLCIMQEIHEKVKPPNTIMDISVIHEKVKPPNKIMDISVTVRSGGLRSLSLEKADNFRLGR